MKRTNNAASAPLVLPMAIAPSGRQQSIRYRSRSLSLAGAVHLAADVFFRFKYRAAGAKSLWSEAERVWLGRETFLYWALWDADINIPWMVAQAMDAPPDADEFREAVCAELAAYWRVRTVSLPRNKQPSWLSLP